MTLTKIHLHKENFKFSAAHFLIFDKHNAEKLHGHNYQVKIDMSYVEVEKFKNLIKDPIKNNNPMNVVDFFIDFNFFKQRIKQYLDKWDEHVLLPQLQPDLTYKICNQNKNYEVNFRERFYSFPKEEVIWLETDNTSVEALSRILAEQLFKEFSVKGIKDLTVTIQETSGQSASTFVN